MNSEDLLNKADAVLGTRFTKFDIYSIPDIENNPEVRLTHGNTGYLGNFTFLYVDMRGSSSFVDNHRLETITKIYKLYHHCMVECIKESNGKVRSFDGDRVLAVFAGANKENEAVFCAMKMAGCCRMILKPKIKHYFNNDNFDIGIGIATGTTMVSKAGVGYDRNNRDLIWIGNAPNLGSKLSDEAKSPSQICICEDTYAKLHDNNKINKHNEKLVNMWIIDNFNFKEKQIRILKTSYYRYL